MTLHNLSCAKELLAVASKLNITARVLVGNEASNYIKFVLDKYAPWKTEGHLSLGDCDGRLDTDINEFVFSSRMKIEPAFLFFEQDNINKNTVVVIENAKDISFLMENSFGMEYFISDIDATYLISVNWYSIEFKGNIYIA